MRFSLVIPCFNEQENLKQLIERCKPLLELPDVEVIVVDNGSTDDSPEIIRSLADERCGLRTIRLDTNRGYGFGILQGLKVARGRYLGWSHADLQADPADVVRGLELIERAGPRAFVKGLRYGRPSFDRFFTFGMSVFEAVVLRHWLKDINAQPTLFSRDFFLTWNRPPNDFSLDLFAFHRARRQNLQEIRFPVAFGRRLYGTSKWNTGMKSRLKFIRRTAEYSLRLARRD